LKIPVGAATSGKGARVLLAVGCVVWGISTPGLAAESTTLELRQTLEGHLQAGEWRDYQVHLEAGQYARVTVEQRTINLSIDVAGAAGKKLFAIDGTDIGDAETAEFIADARGDYRVRVSPSEVKAPDGSYRIVLEEVEAGSERDRIRVQAARSFASAMVARKLGTREALMQAARDLEAARRHWQAAQDPAGQTRALYLAGLVYIEIGDQQKAIVYTSQALPTAQACHDDKLIGRTLGSIGEVHNYFGDKRKAIGYYERALPLLKAAGDLAGEGKTLSSLGVAYSATGERRKALAQFDRAAQIFRDLQDRRMQAEVAGNAGVTFDNLGEYERALGSHQQNLSLVRELGDRPGEAIAQNNVGSAYSGLGLYQKALDAYTAALDLNRAVDNRWNVAINVNNIAWVYANLGDRPRALQFYQESLRLVRVIKDQRRTAIAINNIAEIYADLGEYRKAIELHNEALPLRRAVSDADGEANTLNHLGTAYAKLGDGEKARDHFARALQIHRTSGNRYMLSSTLRNLSVVDREARDYRGARTCLDEALEISRAIHDQTGEAEGLADLARVELDAGNLATARERGDEALTALEVVRRSVVSPALRATLFAASKDLQDLYLEVLMRLHAEHPHDGFDAAALLASERGRARSLLEVLPESGREIRRGVDAALLERENELDRLMAGKAEQRTRLLNGKHTAGEAEAAERELNALAIELEQVQSRIRESSPQYAALTQPSPLDLREIQRQVLDDDTVLLEYALGAKRSFLFAVTRSSMDIFELPARAEVESAAKWVYELLTARNRKPANGRVSQADEALAEAARKAGDMLLGSAAERIANKRLLIVADGALQYLPFPVLTEPGAGERGKPVPLIVKHEVVVAPSASVVAVLREAIAGRSPAPKTAFIVADPVFSTDDARVAQHRPGAEPRGQEFLRLRFSRNEAESIVRLVPAGAALKAVDFDASRERVLATDLTQYRIVHFATHSLLDNQHPELSGVVLSLVDRGGRPQNGFLRLYDIYNLRLASDLVVLSACQTALGEEIKGEGLIGLTRAFLYSGAPRVVATLWEVDDRTTAEMMKRFYEGMLARGERAAVALRSAQVEMWKSKGWEAPYYWGAFTLQGEWR
jgi:CHAT domain-containing protein/Tfp pilus assembly protein PilF